MSIEPGLVHLISPSGALPGYWEQYRKCGICQAPIGAPCRTRADRVVDGRPDGTGRELTIAHGFRKLRAGR